MKTQILSALPIAAALSLPLASFAVPAVAGTQSREIVVIASPRAAALTQWSNRVQADLEAKMRAPATVGPRLFTRDRIVEVKFKCSESGKPTDVTLASSSGDARFDQSALKTVRRLSSLHPMPDGMRPNQRVLAQLMYISSGGERDIANRVMQLRKDAAESNRWFYGNEIASGEMIVLAASR